MQSRWTTRRGHIRHLPNGGTTYVRECCVFQPPKTDEQRKRYTHGCPHCGAQIISRSMPNGGWAHFEGGKGLSKIKHPCLHRDMGGKINKDDRTLDLFEQNEQ